MENMSDTFTDGLTVELPSEIWYETAVSGELEYLTVKQLDFNRVLDISSKGIFIGFATAGAGLMLSLGIAAIIRIFRAA